MPHHRSGALHQSNKSFKSRHATKGAQRAANGGKVERGTVTSSAKRTGVKGGAASADHTNRVKTDRRNAAKLQREKSRAGRLQEHRFFAASTASGAASSAVPKLVAVVPLCPDVDAVKFVERMTEGCEAGSSNLIGRAVRHRSVVADHGHQAVLTFVAFPRPLKQGADAAMDGESSDNHEQHTTHFMDVLGGCQVADYVIVLTSAVEEVDALGAALLESIAAQGAPTMVTAIAHLDKIPAKRHAPVKKSVLAYMRDRFPEAEKMFPVVLDDSLSATATPLVHDPLNFRRYLARTLPKSVHWRDQHAYLLADGVQYDDEACTLAVSGVLRGRALNVQRAVHVPHIGDFLVDRVEIVAPQKHRKKKVVDMATEEKDDASPKISRVVAPRDTDRAVIHEHEPDPMAGEQTWPTEQELLEAEERVKLMREGRGEDGSDGKRIVPKGTSSYQAAWIIDETVLDEDDEVEGDESVKREEDAMMDGPEETATPAHYSEAFGRLSPIREVDEECEEILLEGNASTANTADHASDNDLSDDEEQRQLHAHLHAQQQRTDTLSPADRFLEDLQYPDEIDTPIDTPARVRFQKYRGLKSFRHGDGWDPYEALPRDYARIFQFEDFAGTKRRVLAESEKETMRAASSTSFSAMSLKDNQDGMDVELEDTLVAVGQRVIVHLKEVPSTFRQIYGDDASGVTKPLVLFGLLTHEEKMSVINFTCTRLKKDLNEEEDDEDASNEGVPTIIKSKDPILVQCGFRRYVNRPTYSQHTRGPLYKYERYLVPGRPTVGTMYAPVSFPPCPTLLFIPGANGYPELISRGSVLSIDPTRLIIKRLILTGTPTKVNKGSRHSLNTAVVRYMFFTPEDIHYFKPVELRTKEGRAGHILGSVGTHGAMKCSFDRQIQQSDTICMCLYKRVFPKWPEGGFRGLVHHEVGEDDCESVGGNVSDIDEQ